jgi:hypothetical protein
MYTLFDGIKNKTLICFGAGLQLTRACEAFGDISFFNQIDFIADNDKAKLSFSFSGLEKPIYPIEQCLKYAKKQPVILITMVDCFDVIEQLELISELNNCECFVYNLVRNFVKPYHLPKNRTLKEHLKIPKTIHYCWFGGKPIRDDFIAYIDTWKKYCPDYEIVIWDESNYDYKQNEYMYEAYKQKKWGFVPDYARLDIIYNYGGVYLDTDVELIRNIDDLLCDDAFCGFASRSSVSNGLGFGAVIGFPLILELMKIYDKVSFFNEYGSLNLTASPTFQTEFFRSKGLVLNNTLQKIQDMTIYPSDVLDPFDHITQTFLVTDNTYSIHHYAGTWVSDARHEKTKILREKYRCLAEMINKQEEFNL